MPTFKFRNNTTGEIWEEFMSNTRKEELLGKNPDVEQIPTMFNFVYRTGSSLDSKTDDTFKDVLRNIASHHPNSPLGERYHRRSIKEVKTDNIIKEHRKRWQNV